MMPRPAADAAPDYVAELRLLVARGEEAMRQLSDARAAERRHPGAWSSKEIVGHLIDSASNNHGRFVRAQLQDDLVFPGYAQDRWVALQHYHEQPWSELLTLWAAFNRHLATVMEHAAEEERRRPRPRHNLHLLAWRPVPESDPATLDYFMRDYVGHLAHHLRQILGEEWRPV